MKKIISAGLATILAASALSTAAFAEDQTIVATSVLAKPAIKVTLPKSMAFVFNPYELKVDIKGKISTEDIKDGDDVLNEAVIVPSYQFEETTKGKGWAVQNGTGADLKAAIYAYSVNESSSKFNVIDATGEADDEKKNLLVTISAQGDGDAKTVVLQSAALDTGKTAMDAANATQPKAALVEKFNADKPLYISMEGEVANEAKLSWEETDVANISFVFSFDFSDPAGTTTGGGSTTPTSSTTYNITLEKTTDPMKGASTITINSATVTTGTDGKLAADDISAAVSGSAPGYHLAFVNGSNTYTAAQLADVVFTSTATLTVELAAD